MRNPYSLKKNLFLALFLLIVVIPGGWFIHYLMNTSQASISTAQTNRKIVDEYFNSALGFMQQQQYPQAVQQWKLLLALKPEISEAHVNLGFSLYETGQIDEAYASFNRAMEINPYQLNAYYGLAICYESRGDLKAAIGAMRSFVHLSKEDDPFIRKANAALWEWENKLAGTEEVNKKTLSPDN